MVEDKSDMKKVEDDMRSHLQEINNLYAIDWVKVRVMENNNDWKGLALHLKDICFDSQARLELRKDSIRQTFNNLRLLKKR